MEHPFGQLKRNLKPRKNSFGVVTPKMLKSLATSGHADISLRKAASRASDNSWLLRGGIAFDLAFVYRIVYRVDFFGGI
jgi:hypothetical protein